MNLYLLVTSLTSEALALGVAGVLAPFITQGVKNYLGIDSLKAYAVHLLVSGALAVGALFVNGELNTANLVMNIPLVAMVATTVFQFLKTKYPDPVQPPTQ